MTRGFFNDGSWTVSREWGREWGRVRVKLDVVKYTGRFAGSGETWVSLLRRGGYPLDSVADNKLARTAVFLARMVAKRKFLGRSRGELQKNTR